VGKEGTEIATSAVRNEDFWRWFAKYSDALEKEKTKARQA
jgi:hypothetical protein